MAISLARRNLLAAELPKCASRAGAEFTELSGSESEVRLAYLGEQCRVFVSRGGVTPVLVTRLADDTPLSPADTLVILHYLLAARGGPPVGKSVTFQELWGGSIYIDAFRRRAIQPWIQLVSGCGGAAAASAKERLAGIVECLGATVGGLGDLSISVPILPRLRLAYVYWEGDDELPASGNILFDAGSNDYLPTEDLAYVASVPIWRLGKILATQ